MTLAEVERCAGSQFDPDAAVFVDAYGAGEILGDPAPSPSEGHRAGEARLAHSAPRPRASSACGGSPRR